MGTISRACAELGFQVTATDFLPSTISNLKASIAHKTLEVVQANVEDLPFPR